MEEILINITETPEIVSVSIQETPEQVLIVVNEGVGGGGTVTDRIVGETPVGLKNGINALFLSAYDFIPETLEVYVNGVLQKIPGDYNTSSTTTIILTYSPAVTENITINYNKLII